jgi:membrane-bound lytic murein transglycosylase B
MRFIFCVFICVFLTSAASAESFSVWLETYKQRAAASGATVSAINRAFQGVRLVESVIALDRKQPEGHMTLVEYVDKTVTPKRISKGQGYLVEYASLFDRIEKEYGVPRAVIVALWGKETDYGGFTGNSETISSLATLAYEGRRRDFFERELLNAINLLDYLGMDASQMRGSWAGAIGQCQFMPTNYLQYGVDENRNGRIDLWNEMPDVFASMANMLSQEGWKWGAGWGQKVKIPAEFDKNLIGRDKSPQEFRFWEQRGVRFQQPVPSSVSSQIRLYQPDGPTGPAYALYPNFDVIMRWNKSGYFAVAIGRLSDQISSHP